MIQDILVTGVEHNVISQEHCSEIWWSLVAELFDDLPGHGQVERPRLFAWKNFLFKKHVFSAI